MMKFLLPWKRLRRTILLLIIFVTIVIMAELFTSLLWQPLLQSSLPEREKCPACFGTSLCEAINSGAIYLTGSSRFRLLNYMANLKNVYFGNYREKLVVLKKLAHDDELQEADEKICARAQATKHCDVSEAMKEVNVTNTWSLGKVITEVPTLTVCPSDHLFDRMLDTYTERSKGQPLSPREQLSLVTTLLVNPEPVILQMFPQSQGWPFPHYYGACGRLVVMENAGITLSDVYNAPWWQRVKIAHQVMQIAELFTNNTSGFNLYWTDLGLDNLALTDSGRVMVIDAEHVLVIDRQKIESDKPPSWDEPVVTDHIECKGDDGFSQCVQFQIDALCSHVTSDINYYTACRLMLSRSNTGLLHDVPRHVDRRYALGKLIEECTKPRTLRDRFVVKDKLLSVLGILARNQAALWVTVLTATSCQLNLFGNIV
ncbi:Divergent protein kinase domain 2A [Lamellibrachia satsuma]|nr:Divergent protein kinase domain 2A [Lamellibrachia satsuma]